MYDDIYRYVSFLCLSFCLNMSIVIVNKVQLIAHVSSDYLRGADVALDD